MKRIVLGLTGASGSLLFKKLLEELVQLGHEVFIVASTHGEEVFQFECELNFKDYINTFNKKHTHLCHIDDMFHQIASGSFKTDGMIILPCSMGTLSKVAHGNADTLLLRAADVHIKEQRKLLLGFREAPLSAIHIHNMQLLIQARVILYPTVISFYNKPQSLDEAISQMIGRILNYFEIETKTKIEWMGN